LNASAEYGIVAPAHAGASRVIKAAATIARLNILRVNIIMNSVSGLRPKGRAVSRPLGALHHYASKAGNVTALPQR
jgi:hypothetical protein